MRTAGWEERLRVLDEAVMAFQVARRAAEQVGFGDFGWLRMVRTAVDIPSMEAARRVGVVQSALFRMDYAESDGRITLNTLRKGAEALGCELVYGLVPKEGSLRERAAAIEAGKAERRRAAYAVTLEKQKAKRLEEAKESWRARQQETRAAEWLGRWAASGKGPLDGGEPPKLVRETPFWREQMRKAIRKALRKGGIRAGR